MSRSRVGSFGWAALFAAMTGCGGSAGNGSGLEAPKFEPKDQTKCSVAKSQSEPLVVEWPSAARAELEAVARRGVVVVRYEGCEMRVLRDCRAPGRYGYVGLTRKHDKIRIRDADELYANLPVYAVKFEGELARAGELAVDMTIVGRYETPNTQSIDESALEGRCAGATHVLSGLTIGAFEFYTNADSKQKAGAGVLGVEAGGSTQRSKETLNQDGDRGRCERSTGSDASPPDGCGAILRVEAVPLGQPKRAQPQCPAATEWDGRACVARGTPAAPAAVAKLPARAYPRVSCPEGTKQVGSICEPGSMTPCPTGQHLVVGKQCVPDDAVPYGLGAQRALQKRGMAKIAAGTFLFGSYEGGPTPRKISMPAFSMDVTEVTVGEYARCMAAGACPAPYDSATHCNFGRSQRNDYPMNCVTREAAKDYCGWVGKHLPTQEEWEFAARGKEGRRYPWGSDEGKRNLCWNRSGFTPCPVGAHPEDRTPEGVLDLGGNVHEWVASDFCFSPNSAGDCHEKIPIHRGGDWEATTLDAVKATVFAYTYNPTQSNIGFRCAKTGK
jgi:formylglycine-generating enzyme required for sulfatase activity